MLSWLVTRHILFLIVIYSMIFEGPKYVEFKWDYEAGYYITETAFKAYWVMLLALQVWFLTP